MNEVGRGGRGLDGTGGGERGMEKMGTGLQGMEERGHSGRAWDGPARTLFFNRK
jgi:hypothetical protein